MREAARQGHCALVPEAIPGQVEHAQTSVDLKIPLSFFKF